MVSVENGYTLGGEDYLNDQDVREILQRILDVAPSGLRSRLTESITPWDERFRAATIEGDDWPRSLKEKKRPSSHVESWWYGRYPRDGFGNQARAERDSSPHQNHRSTEHRSDVPDGASEPQHGHRRSQSGQY